MLGRRQKIGADAHSSLGHIPGSVSSHPFSHQSTRRARHGLSRGRIVCGAVGLLIIFLIFWWRRSTSSVANSSLEYKSSPDAKSSVILDARQTTAHSENKNTLYGRPFATSGESYIDSPENRSISPYQGDQNQVNVDASIDTEHARPVATFEDFASSSLRREFRPNFHIVNHLSIVRNTRKLKEMAENVGNHKGPEMGEKNIVNNKLNALLGGLGQGLLPHAAVPQEHDTPPHLQSLGLTPHSHNNFRFSDFVELKKWRTRDSLSTEGLHEGLHSAGAAMVPAPNGEVTAIYTSTDDAQSDTSKRLQHLNDIVTIDAENGDLTIVLCAEDPTLPLDSTLIETFFSKGHHQSIERDYQKDFGHVLASAINASATNLTKSGKLRVLRGLNVKYEKKQDLIDKYNDQHSTNAIASSLTAQQCTILISAERILPRNVRRSLKENLFANGPRKERSTDIEMSFDLSQSATSTLEMMETGYSILLASEKYLVPLGRERIQRVHDTADFDNDKAVARIYAQSRFGVLNGIRSIIQLTLTTSFSKLHGSNDIHRPSAMPFSFSTPSLYIRHDIPKLPWRGQHVDSSRHFVEVPTVLHLLSEMGKLKMNRFHWHLSDDQGWRVESKVFPQLHKAGSRRSESLNGAKMNKYKNSLSYGDGSDEEINWSSVLDGKSVASPPTRHFYSYKDIEYVIRFAAARGILVVPEVDLPAHAHAFVNAMLQEQEDRGLEAVQAAMKIETEAGEDDLHTWAPLGVNRGRIPLVGAVVRPGDGNSDCHLPDSDQRLKTFDSKRQAINCMGGSFGMIYPTFQAAELVKTVLAEMINNVFGSSPQLLSDRSVNARGSHNDNDLASWLPKATQSYFHIGGDQAQFIRSKVWNDYFSSLKSLTSELERASTDTERGRALAALAEIGRPLVNNIKSDSEFGTLQATLTDTLIDFLTTTPFLTSNMSEAEVDTSLVFYHPHPKTVPELNKRDVRYVPPGVMIKLSRQIREQSSPHHRKIIQQSGDPRTYSPHSTLVSSAVVWDDTLMDLNATYVPPATKSLVMLWRGDGVNLNEVRARLAGQDPRWLESFSDRYPTLSDGGRAERGLSTNDRERDKKHQRKFGLPHLRDSIAQNSITFELTQFYFRLWQELDQSSPNPIAPRIILTPKTHSYFDYIQHSPMSENRVLPMQSPAPWIGYPAITLRKTFELHALAEELQMEQAGQPGKDDPFVNRLVMGIQGCVWTELIKAASDLEYQLFPRLMAVADAGWTRRPIIKKRSKRQNKKATEHEAQEEFYQANSDKDTEYKRRLKNLVSKASGSLAEVAQADVSREEYRGFEDAVMLLGLASATERLSF